MMSRKGIARHFEDLEIWQKGMELVKEIYEVIDKNKDFRKDKVLSEHIRRTAISIVSNIAEGFGRGTNKEFVYFLFVTRGSLCEIQTQLHIASRLFYITESEFQKLYSICEEILRMVANLIRHLQKTGKKGIKYHFHNEEPHEL